MILETVMAKYISADTSPLKLYVIPELTAIVLDYYYSMIYKENTVNLISEYHKRYIWNESGNCINTAYGLLAFNYRTQKYFDFDCIFKIENSKHCGVLPVNYWYSGISQHQN